jgi:serine protease Do
VTTALLLAGSALTLATGFPAGAQVAQNDSSQIQAITPRQGAPSSFADLTAQLQPAVVNISTRQRVKVQNNNPFAGTPFGDLFGGGQGGGGGTREAQSLGSGFIISADGYRHQQPRDHRRWPGRSRSISVTTPDGTEYPAKLVGKDARPTLPCSRSPAPSLSRS